MWSSTTKLLQAILQKWRHLRCSRIELPLLECAFDWESTLKLSDHLYSSAEKAHSPLWELWYFSPPWDHVQTTYQPMPWLHTGVGSPLLPQMKKSKGSGFHPAPSWGFACQLTTLMPSHQRKKKDFLFHFTPSLISCNNNTHSSLLWSHAKQDRKSIAVCVKAPGRFVLIKSKGKIYWRWEWNKEKETI